MTILPLVISPDPRLLVCSEAISKDEINDNLRTFLNDMVETMRCEEGVGLAAVQVGVHKRILVMEINDEIYYLINPEIIFSSEEQNLFEEGCLSFPGQRSAVIRPKQVTVKYLDEFGLEQKLECDELLATCVQHEIDHLNGVVFVDRISKLKRDVIMRKMKKMKKAHQEYPHSSGVNL